MWKVCNPLKYLRKIPTCSKCCTHLVACRQGALQRTAGAAKGALKRDPTILRSAP
jgi:hypothetical protein